MLLPVCALVAILTTSSYQALLPSRFTALQKPLQQAQLNTLTNYNSDFLYLSAVTNTPEPPHAAQIQCLRLPRPFMPYPTVGTSLALLPHLDRSNMTLVRLPPNSSEPLHHPPHPMLFILLSGLAHVRLPADPTGPGLWIVEGVNPIIVATDVLGEGHWTDYPGNKDTLALQLPFGPSGGLGAADIVHDGSCRMKEGWDEIMQELTSSF